MLKIIAAKIELLLSFEWCCFFSFCTICSNFTAENDKNVGVLKYSAARSKNGRNIDEIACTNIAITSWVCLNYL